MLHLNLLKSAETHLAGFITGFALIVLCFPNTDRVLLYFQAKEPKITTWFSEYISVPISD